MALTLVMILMQRFEGLKTENWQTAAPSKHLLKPNWMVLEARFR